MLGPKPKVRVDVPVEQASECFLNVVTDVNLPKGFAIQFQDKN